jgi:hypothetical protein
MAVVDEAPSVEMAHDVGWLRGLFTMAWALEGVGVECSGGRGKRRGEQGRGRSGRRRKDELFGGALLLKPHEAVADGSRNGGRERRAKPWVRARRRPRHLCSDREVDGWAPHGFDFFSYLSKTGSTLKIQKRCLILLQKFPIFASGPLEIL